MANIVGKRYVCTVCGSEFIVTKGGDGRLECHRRDFLLLARSEDEAPALHYRFLNRRLDLPLHQSWAAWLWARGLNTGEVEPLESVGVHAYRCRPDESSVGEDISDAVRRRALTVPADEDLAQAA